MQQASAPTLSILKTELEDLWRKFDQAYSGLGTGGWAKKYGKDWVFADQPFHMAFFDRVMVADAIANGDRLQEADRGLLGTMDQINKWNEGEFAKRPVGQTAQKSHEEWNAAREAIRRAIASMSDADMSKRVWIHLLMGWSTVRDALFMSWVHSAGEYAELRMRLKNRPPDLTPAAAHARLGFMMQFMAMGVNQEMAKQKPFTAVWNFTGNGGGAWTLRAKDGACAVKEERDAKPDITMTLNFYTFEKMARKMSSPMWLMLTRQLKVKGMSKMGTFSKLFPPP